MTDYDVFNTKHKVFELSKILRSLVDDDDVTVWFGEGTFYVKQHQNRYTLTEEQTFEIRPDGTVYGKLEP